MTIQLTTACFINGSLAASGSQHTLDEATEAGLIYQGMATRVGSAPNQDGVVNPVYVSTESGSQVLIGPDGAISTGGAFRGVALYQSADDSALNSIAFSTKMGTPDTGTQVLWSAALYDTDSAFNPATPGVVTLPTDISYLNVSASINFVSASGGQRRLRLTLNNTVHWSSASAVALVGTDGTNQATSVMLNTGWIPRPVGMAQIQINAWQNQTAGTALLLAGADADVTNYGGSTFFRVEFK